MSVKLSDEEKAANIADRREKRARKVKVNETFDKARADAGWTLYSAWRRARDAGGALMLPADVQAACIALDVAFLAKCEHGH